MTSHHLLSHPIQSNQVFFSKTHSSFSPPSQPIPIIALQSPHFQYPAQILFFPAQNMPSIRIPFHLQTISFSDPSYTVTISTSIGENSRCQIRSARGNLPWVPELGRFYFLLIIPTYYQPPHLPSYLDIHPHQSYSTAPMSPHFPIHTNPPKPAFPPLSPSPST